MYTKEDFNKDFEQIKETLKNIDFTKVATEGKENIKLATDEFKNLYNKITDIKTLCLTTLKDLIVKNY